NTIIILNSQYIADFVALPVRLDICREGHPMEEPDKLFRNGYVAAMSKQQSDLPKKILVIRFSSIGDIVLCSPVFRLLKRQWNSEIHWLTKSKYQFVNEHNPHIDKIYTFENDYKDLLKELRAENYGLIVDLHKNLRSWRFKRSIASPSISFDKRNIQKWILVNLR